MQNFNGTTVLQPAPFDTTKEHNKQRKFKCRWSNLESHVSWNDVNDSVHYDVGSVLNRVELRL